MTKLIVACWNFLNSPKKGQTSMPSAGFDLPIPAIELPQTYALDPAATGFDWLVINDFIKSSLWSPRCSSRQTQLKGTSKISLSEFDILRMRLRHTKQMKNRRPKRWLPCVECLKEKKIK